MAHPAMSFLTSQATLEAKEAVKMAAQTQNLTAGGGWLFCEGWRVWVWSEFMNSLLGCGFT